jgi:hypothetical protein
MAFALVLIPLDAEEEAAPVDMQLCIMSPGQHAPFLAGLQLDSACFVLFGRQPRCH